MPVLYVTEMDAVLRKEHEVLVISRDGEALARVPLPRVEQVVLLGPVSVSTQVLVHKSSPLETRQLAGGRKAGRADRCGHSDCGKSEFRCITAA